MTDEHDNTNRIALSETLHSTNHHAVSIKPFPYSPFPYTRIAHRNQWRSRNTNTKSGNPLFIVYLRQSAPVEMLPLRLPSMGFALLHPKIGFSSPRTKRYRCCVFADSSTGSDPNKNKIGVLFSLPLLSFTSRDIPQNLPHCWTACCSRRRIFQVAINLVFRAHIP